MKCLVEGCDKSRVSRGFCKNHYQALRRDGGLPSAMPCLVTRCGRFATALGYCHKHYEMWRKHNDPTPLRRQKKRHNLYVCWNNMHRRCDPISGHKDYGGRGIKVCKRWLDDFWAFVEDMGPRPSPQHSIDRINHDGDYEPGNCRWATRKQQSQNRRMNKMDQRYAEEARRRYRDWGDSVANIARSLRLPYQPVWQAIKGVTWN